MASALGLDSAERAARQPYQLRSGIANLKRAAEALTRRASGSSGGYISSPVNASRCMSENSWVCTCGGRATGVMFPQECCQALGSPHKPQACRACSFEGYLRWAPDDIALLLADKHACSTSHNQWDAMRCLPSTHCERTPVAQAGLLQLH